MQTRLIALGAVLVLFGALIMAGTFGRLPDERIGSPTWSLLTGPAGPSRILPIAGGFALAAGMALVGIGANRWYAAARDRNRGLH
jgi:hypothetical protein